MKKQNGITLIALVITIIVILILAGVFFLTVVGENGIINKAVDSKISTERARLYEDVGLAYTEYKSQIEKQNDLDYYLNNINNASVEKLADDTWCVTRDNNSVTIKKDGDITEGRVLVWNGNSTECPEIKKEDNEWNWYIYTAGQLKFLADFVNNGNSLTETLQNKVEEAGYNASDVVLDEGSTIYLMNNLDLGARPQNGNWDTEENNIKKWIPIGDTTQKPLIAKFEGNNKYISGIYVNAEQAVGLFGTCNNLITNLTIKNSYIKGSDGVGGIVGIKRSGNLENCHNVNTEVTGTGRIIGGIVGQIAGSIINCTNNGTIISTTTTTNSQIGGIVGRAIKNEETNKIDKCINNGRVLSSNIGIGGIAGYSKIDINNCTNNSEIESNYDGIVFIGGIVGYTYDNLEVTNCNNFGKISGVNTVGGIAGKVCTGLVSKCNNNGSVFATKPSAGGILGAAGENVKTEYCVNKGEINGDLNSGGIMGIGFQSSEIIKCTNFAKVNGTENVGGISGDLASSGKVLECENSGKINGTQRVGGIIGEGYQETTVKDSKNTAEINGDYDVGGIVGVQFGDGLISDCTNSGAVNGSENLGGIAGCVANTVTRCSNTANVTGTNVDIGGIVGSSIKARGHNITYCYNSGNIKGKNEVGGINGYLGSAGASPKADKCYNKGIITILKEGGSIGEIASRKSYDAQITNCYFLKTTEYESTGSIRPQNNGAEEIEVDLKTFEEFLTWIENQ